MSQHHNPHQQKHHGNQPRTWTALPRILRPLVNYRELVMAASAAPHAGNHSARTPKCGDVTSALEDDATAGSMNGLAATVRMLQGLERTLAAEWPFRGGSVRRQGDDATHRHSTIRISARALRRGRRLVVSSCPVVTLIARNVRHASTPCNMGAGLPSTVARAAASVYSAGYDEAQPLSVQRRFQSALAEHCMKPGPLSVSSVRAGGAPSPLIPSSLNLSAVAVRHLKTPHCNTLRLRPAPSTAQSPIDRRPWESFKPIRQTPWRPNDTSRCSRHPIAPQSGSHRHGRNRNQPPCTAGLARRGTNCSRAGHSPVDSSVVTTCEICQKGL